MVFTCQVNCLAASQGGTGGRENSEGRRRKASREDTTRAEAYEHGDEEGTTTKS